jgi:hypothetical protein
MSNNRTQILRESGHIVLDAAGTPATFYSETPISVELMEEQVALPSAMFGDLDQIPVGRLVKIKFIPQQFSLARGASLLASTDKTLDIHTTSGKRCRIPNAFLYAEPAIRGDIKKTPFGEVEFWGIVPLSGNGDALVNFFNETSVAYPGDAALNTSQMITPAWAVTIDGDSIDLAESGFEIKGQPKYVEDKVNGAGVINVALTDYKVQVTVEALNLTRPAVMAWAGFGTALGGRKSAVGLDIIAQASNIYVLARHAVYKPGANFKFGAEPRSVDRLTFETIRTFAENIEQPQLVVNDND